MSILCAHTPTFSRANCVSLSLSLHLCLSVCLFGKRALLLWSLWQKSRTFFKPLLHARAHCVSLSRCIYFCLSVCLSVCLARACALRIFLSFACACVCETLLFFV